MASDRDRHGSRTDAAGRADTWQWVARNPVAGVAVLAEEPVGPGRAAGAWRWPGRGGRRVPAADECR
jgi:hypothetical protein